MKWQAGTRYIQLPNQRISIGSKFPTLHLSYVNGIKGLGSDIDYSRWKVQADGRTNLKLFGSISYNVAAGGFLKAKSIFFPDYQHFRGNQFRVVSQELTLFQLMPYYSFSNIDRFYSTLHLAYHFNGLLTNKIPLFKKLNWFLVAGTNLLYLADDRTTYIETFAGLENILKVIRIDYVKSFGEKYRTDGVRISLPIFTSREEN